MRRVLFDENLPRLLRRKLSEFEIRTVQEEGWGAFKNGELLRRAEGHFDVLLTADRRMQAKATGIRNRSSGHCYPTTAASDP